MASDVNSNVADVQSDMESLKQAILKGVADIIEDACTQGEDVATKSYSNAEYTGTNDIQVTSDVQSDKGSIEASGTTVLFIEFGTGVTNAEHPMADQFGYKHGTYGKGFGNGPCRVAGGWYYRGDKGNSTQTEPYEHIDGSRGADTEGLWWTTGVPANMGMYQASQKAKSIVTPNKLKEAILANYS